MLVMNSVSPLVAVIDVLVAVQRHLVRRRKLRQRTGTRLALPGALDALLDSGVEDFLHLGFVERAITGVFDAVTEVIKIGAEGIQRRGPARKGPHRRDV